MMRHFGDVRSLFSFRSEKQRSRAGGVCALLTRDYTAIKLTKLITISVSAIKKRRERKKSLVKYQENCV